ncbi:uncharacterized protein F5891DRAFT_1131386 [Suillus fuscotomentosus]|uniref:Uncharacterized protein n=1 Tax=Suillus fuscotomentosus TaxID=1912939 RepID=A0AAD4DSK2_9AGAM|nr:uncharacterized protein F5891DRAFT_1131386 [Suillus fuscotomentosus]KAG1893062.1 hypothetical protein F5891DRAFT_1131386 [Suillus fuscotomentosus]
MLNLLERFTKFEEDDIQVQYHPSSQCPTQVFQFEDYGRGLGAPTVVPPVEPEPWYPFQTRINFEVVELVLEAALTHQQTDWLFDLIRRTKSEQFTLRNRKDVRDTWDAASFKLTPFVKEEVVVPFQGDDKTFQLFHRSIWDWAVDLLQDPQVGPHFVFDAERLSKFNSDKFVWFIHEPWTANAFWEYQSQIPSDAKPLAFILYTDKAKLLSFGRVKGYPVVARCANLPVAIRNGEGLGGGCVVGWLPIVKEDKKHSGKPVYVNFKNAVWHQSFLKILACLALLSKFGSAIKCWDDIIRIFYLIILILSADYEEQSVMALIHGLMGKFPCPICFVPRDELSKTSNIYPLRTSAGAKALRVQARDSESLHDVDNSFDTMENTDVHRALSHDKLHFNDGGLFSDHLWAELQKWIESSGRQAAVQIDSSCISSFHSFPHWRNLNHFDQVTSISFSDGMKYEDISKETHNVFHQDQDSEAYLLLRCIRSYVEFNTYASLDIHTEDTIKDGRKALENLTQLMDKYIEDTLDLIDKLWNFPKKHLSAHLFDDIEAKGVTQNYNTKLNKKMHGPLKDAYQDHTNFKNFAEQLSCLNAQKLSLLDASDLPEIDSETELMTDGLHFSLGSPQAMQSFADVEASKTGNPAFIQFRIKLNEFLNHAFNANNIPFPNGRRIQLAADDTNHSQITEYQFLKVNYESLVDWRVSADYLRCSPMFHGLPRYDFVILQTEVSVIFAQLLMVFTCMVGDVQYPIMLTLPYDQPVGAHPRKDKDLDFWRVKAKPQ